MDHGVLWRKEMIELIQALLIGVFAVVVATVVGIMTVAMVITIIVGILMAGEALFNFISKLWK